MTIAIVVGYGASAYAWGPLTHAYVAQRIFPQASARVLFGAASADMFDFAFFNRPLRTQFKRLTHFETDRIELSAFRLGMLTHNQAWGADAYAHAYGKPGSNKPFPRLMFEKFSRDTGLTMQQAEDILEITMEYVLRTEAGPPLGARVTAWADAVGQEEENALLAAFAETLCRRVPGLAPRDAAESIQEMFRRYREFLQWYGRLLSMDDAELHKIPGLVFSVMFDVDRTTAERWFARAVELCAKHRPELDQMADAIRGDLYGRTLAAVTPRAALLFLSTRVLP
jgi:hypothetical protein